MSSILLLLFTTLATATVTQVLVSGKTFFRIITAFLGSDYTHGMETFDIIQLVRYGRVDEILNILDRTVSTREIFLQQVGPNLNQFIGLAACTGSIEILERCTMNYDVEIKIGSELGLDTIVGAASRGHDHVIKWLLEPWIKERRQMEQGQDFNEMRLPQNWLYPSLHKAILGQHVSTVKLLVEKAMADVNGCYDGKLRPLHLAADTVLIKNNPDRMSRYEAIIDILVTNNADPNFLHPLRETTPLHDAVKLNSHKAVKRLIDGGADVRIPRTKDKRTVLHLVAEAGSEETLRILVDHGRLREMDPSYFDVEDENGATPLYVAASGGQQECVRILINKGLSLISGTMKSDRDLSMDSKLLRVCICKYCCVFSEMMYKVTVMDLIFERIPNPVTFLTEILDEQVTATDKSGNNITMDFRLLVSKHSHDGKHRFSDMDVFVALTRAAQKREQMAILQHPLLEIFLRSQYLTALPCGIIVFALHLVASGSSSWYITHWHEVTSLKSNLLGALSFASGVIVFFENIIRNILFAELVNFDKLNYFVIYTSNAVSAINSCHSTMLVGASLMGLRYNISPKFISIESIMVMLLWIDLMLLSVQFPIIGEYSFMFFAVLMNIGKVLLSFIWLIAAFVLVFPVLFPDNNQFDSPWKAIVKTVVMMTGEYEYGDILSSTDQSNSTSNDSTSAENNNGPQQAVSILVFLIFVIVCSITLMNFMVGLAVDDIQELRKKGHIRRLLTQANWVAHMNRIPCCNRRSPRKLELNLNNRSWISRIRIPTRVWKPLYDLALRNYNRKERPQTESPRNATQEILTAIQTSYAAMQSSLQRVVLEQRIQNCQIKQLKQDRKPKWRRRSL